MIKKDLFGFSLLFILVFISFSYGQEKAENAINIKEGAMVFTPENIKIKVGETVKWINNDHSIPNHMFASIPGSGPEDKLEIDVVTLEPGQKYEHTFNQEGEYPYFCFIHRSMSGKVVVTK